MGEMIVAASEIPLPSLSWQPVSGSEGESKSKRAIEREEKFILIFVCYAFTEFVGIYANNRCSSHASFSPYDCECAEMWAALTWACKTVGSQQKGADRASARVITSPDCG